MSDTQSVTKCLADFIDQSTYESLPDEVIFRAKLCVLDALGCAVGGLDTPIAAATFDALELQGSGKTTVIGTAYRASAQDSAFVNATLINALDFDDDNGIGHPSATVLPAALAAAEECNVTGKELLLAFVLGYEVSTRIGWATCPSTERCTVAWGVGTHQAFGAAAAAAKLMRIPNDGMLDALGLAGAAAPVPSALKWGWECRPLTWIKDVVALPSLAGILAAKLARSGFHGCRDVLDGQTGFWAMAGSDRCDFNFITRDLGRQFHLLRGSFKPYPACRYLHVALDLVGLMMNLYHLHAQEIAEIVVRSCSETTSLLSRDAPISIVDAEFSGPYTIALVVLGIPPGIGWYSTAAFRDPQLCAIASRVRFETDPAADQTFHIDNPRYLTTVRITTAQGDTFEKTADCPKGDPDNPMSEEEISKKFLSMVGPRLGEHRAHALRTLVLDLDNVKGASAFVRSWTK